MNGVVDYEPEVFAELVANSVHDIKNSIGVLLSAADSLAAQVSCSSAVGVQALTLQHEARRINYDLIHLLGLFKFERAHAGINLQVVDCDALLAEIAAFNTDLLAARGIRLSTECGDASEGYFDRELVQGVINSIVNNAFHHACKQVTVSCEVHDGYTVLAVADDGPGYGPKLLAMEAAPGATAYTHGNTGLGLYFARRIAAMHQHRERCGRVVLSNQGFAGGGRFELWLP